MQHIWRPRTSKLEPITHHQTIWSHVRTPTCYSCAHSEFCLRCFFRKRTVHKLEKNFCGFLVRVLPDATLLPRTVPTKDPPMMKWGAFPLETPFDTSFHPNQVFVQDGISLLNTHRKPNMSDEMSKRNRSQRPSQPSPPSASGVVSGCAMSRPRW